MARLIYALAVSALVGGSAVMAGGVDSDARMERTAAVRLIAGQHH